MVAACGCVEVVSNAYRLTIAYGNGGNEMVLVIQIAPELPSGLCGSR